MPGVLLLQLLITRIQFSGNIADKTICVLAGPEVLAGATVYKAGNRSEDDFKYAVYGAS